jgi:hypothetical protein
LKCSVEGNFDNVRFFLSSFILELAGSGPDFSMLTDDKGKKGGKNRDKRGPLGLRKDYRYRGTTISFRSSAHFDVPAHFNFFLVSHFTWCCCGCDTRGRTWERSSVHFPFETPKRRANAALKLETIHHHHSPALLASLERQRGVN